jgi:crotonobetaine/carnitine-CoA ligase
MGEGKMIINLDGTCFGDLWRDAVSTRSNATFLVFETSSGSSHSWTYAEFDDVVARAAATLDGLGVRKGESVSLALTNSPAFVALWLAAVRLGAWIVPSDPQSRTQELVEHQSRTNSKVGICSVHREDEFRAAAHSIPVIAIDEDDCELTVFGTEKFTNWPTLDIRDRAAVMFTSGTTGRPKGVDISQANYSFAGQVMATASGLTPDDRQLVVLPLFHANAQYYSFASAIAVGASVALMSTFSATRFLQQAKTYNATHASLFAAPIRMILARGNTPVPGLALKHCWYAMNIADHQYAELAQLLSCQPRQLYGMTETIPAVLTDEARAPRPDCMGYVSAGCELDVQDSAGNSVAVGEIGEIVVGGTPGVTLFSGYLDDPETTAKNYRGRWFLTGDRATRDESGRHFFDGRRADVLKVAGENVSTVEVEQVLSSHPDILEAAVIGQPDEIRDEVPVGFVVARDPHKAPTVAELHTWCEDRLAKSKRPRDITYVDELPRTSVGKIRKFILKESQLS